MIWSNIRKNTWLVYIPMLTCILSILVFGYFLFQSSKIQSQAFASSYSLNQVVLAVNQERIKNKLPSLIINDVLNQSAQAKTDDMVEKSYFSHKSPVDKKWSDFIKEVNYDYSIAGENLANGFDTLPRMIEAWMNSPSHRENILNKDVIDTGVGISYGKLDGKPTIFVAQHFGKLDKTDTEVKTSSVNSISISPKDLDKKLVNSTKFNSLSEILSLPPQQNR